MARPVPRRREAPTADAYTGRRGGTDTLERDEEAVERRPRRGRARTEEPAEEPTRRRRRAPEPEPETDPFPASLADLEGLDDASYDAVLEALGEAAPEDTDDLDGVWEAIEGIRAEQEEPAPRSRRRRSAPEPEEEEDEPAPRRGRGRRAAAEEDEEDEAPKRVARRGFQGFKKTQEATSSFADDFKLTDEEVLVKFLEDEPFATYGEHGLYRELNEGQRVWVCLEPDEDCPVCDTGHRPRPVALWNIVVLPEEGKPELKVLKAGPKLEKLLEKKASLKTGPMSKEYYSLSQTAGKNDGPVEYSVELVRTRDLDDPDGWATTPLTKDELGQWRERMHAEDFVKFPTQKDMKAVARKLTDADD